MIYCFDFDGTLVTSTDGDYGRAKPIVSRVAKVKELYADGHTIVISTARGVMWKEFTRSQLDAFGIPFHVLSCGAKPSADLYVDDKAVDANRYFADGP